MNQKADAIVTNDSGRVVSVRIADCVPILMATDDGRHVAAIHAGWRGVIANIVQAAIAALDAPPSDLWRPSAPASASTPSKSARKSSINLIMLSAQNHPPAAAPTAKGTSICARPIFRQLTRLGITPGRIDVTDRCTYRDKQEFFSHRRDNGVTGRMSAIIAPAV